MKKDELTVVNSNYHHLRTPTTTTTSSRVSDTHSASSSSSSSGCSRRSLHFFVRMMSGGNTIVIHANSDDSVVSVHEQIRKITGISIIEQRLIYRGKQLQWEQSLAECSVQNDAGLQLVGRMRSTEYPKTWRIVNDLVSSVCRLCREESKNLGRIVVSRLVEFLKMIPENEEDISAGHLQEDLSELQDQSPALTMRKQKKRALRVLGKELGRRHSVFPMLHLQQLYMLAPEHIGFVFNRLLEE